MKPPIRRAWHPRPRKLFLGFTLLELLVVIALMTILAALTLGSLHHAKTVARRLACLNNLKQWGYVTHIYANEQADRLPREAAIDGLNTWEMTAYPTNEDVWYNALALTAGFTTMAQYARTPSSQQDFYSAGNLFHCPAARFSEIAATYPNFSLAINSKLMRDYERTEPPSGGDPVSTSNPEICKVSNIKVPVKTALFLDNGLPGEPQLCLFQAPYTGEPKSFASQFPGRHNGAGNIAFFDGHALSLPGRRVVEMDPASVFRGRAIYPPGEVVWCPDPASVP